jgi:hypothetical protein
MRRTINGDEVAHANAYTRFFPHLPSARFSHAFAGFHITTGNGPTAVIDTTDQQHFLSRIVKD